MNTHNYLLYDGADPNHRKNNIPSNPAKRIIVFVSNPEKVLIRLDELRQLLKGCKYPEHVISKNIFNAKLQGPARNPERSKNIIPFVTTYYPNIDNKSLMQTVKNKFKNIRNVHLRSIYKDANFTLCLKQLKRLYRELTCSGFISSFKTIRKPGAYKYSDKRCSMCQNYLNETKKFTMSNGQVWEIHRENDCHSVNVICYLKCKMSKMKKEHILVKTKGDNTQGIKVRINQHISNCNTVDTKCNFLRHVYNCGIKNSCLEEPFFCLNIMLRLNKSDRLETIEKHMHYKAMIQ